MSPLTNDHVYLAAGPFGSLPCSCRKATTPLRQLPYLGTLLKAFLQLSRRTSKPRMFGMTKNPRKARTDRRPQGSSAT